MKCDIRITWTIIGLLAILSGSYVYAALIGMKTAVDSIKEPFMLGLGALLAVWRGNHPPSADNAPETGAEPPKTQEIE